MISTHATGTPVPSPPPPGFRNVVTPFDLNPRGHWKDMIQISKDRLNGKYGEVDDEGRETIKDELEIPKVNTEDAIKHLN